MPAGAQNRGTAGNEPVIVVGVTGSIAAYKTCELVSRLVRDGCSVHVIATDNALEFVGEITFRTLSGNEVIADLFACDSPLPHVNLGEEADCLVVAPATANIIGKIAGGIGDDVLSTFALSLSPVIIAPAMHDSMYSNPIVQKNVAKLAKRGYVFVGPAEGRLASGGVGKGRMADVEEIIETVYKTINRKPRG